MIRTLLIISGAAAVVCAAAVGGALALGGNDLARHGWSWTLRDSDGGDSIHFQRVDGDPRAALGPMVDKRLDWTGGDTLIVDLGADVDYIQGDQPGVQIRGPQRLVDRIRLDGNRLTMADGDNEEQVVFGWRRGELDAWSDRDALSIIVTAPSVTKFDLRGSQSLSLAGYDQPSLSIAMSGSGEVEGSGRTRTVDIDIDGSGEVDLERMDVTDATVAVSGSGEVTVGATGTVEVDISGSGDVNLTKRPARLTQDISGSGDVRQD